MECPTMESFSDEQMNYFKFSSIVLDVFLATLRQVFVSMWDRLAARTPGCQNWDDSTTVRDMFLAKEGGKIDNIPTDKSYLEWDCTALFQATLFSQTFALPDEYGKWRTLYQLYVKPLPIGTFHDCVLSPTGNTAETWALALDQLRLLRNTLCQSSTVQMMDKTTFDYYLMLARDAFTALEQNSIGIDSIEELTEDNFPSAKIQQLKLGLERENGIVIEFKQVNNLLNAIKSQAGIQVESDKWQCSHGHSTFYLRNVINEIVSMKKDEQSDKRKKDLKLLLSCLEEEVKMDLLENLNAESVACIICKEWIFSRVIYFILTDKGVNSDCVDAASGSSEIDPDVFLFSPLSDPKKKSPFVVVWKTPSVLEMKELSHVGSTLHESILMLFLQPQFQKNCVVDQDFYMELTLPTYATSSLCTQIMYLPVLVVLELSKSNKDCSNIDSIVNLPSIHVSFFSYRFSNQRHAEFVFDNLICSLGKLLAVTEVQHAVISPLHNVAICFFLDAKFSNSSLSVVVEKDSVIVKCYSICEFESTCICLSVRNSLESKMESLSHDFRTSWKSCHLELHCEKGGISHHCKDFNREPPCSGLASESTNACACACGSNPLYALEGEQSISLPQKKDETNIGHADLGDVPLDGPLWCILEYAGLESVYTKSDLQASVSDEVPLPDSAHCDVSKQLDTSLLSVCSNSSLNSCPTTPSDPAQKAPDFYEHAPQNSSMASVDCSASNFASQENSSQLSSGVNNIQDCSVMKSSYEEGLSSLSGKDIFDSKARKVEPLEDTVEETPKEPKCDLQDAHSSYNTESVALPCTASQRSPDPSVLTDLPRNQEGTVAMQISQLQSDIAFYQHQCSEERQRSSELEEKLKQSEEEKMQLKAEVGRYQFLECKEKRSEKILHSSTTLISEQSKSCPTNGWCSAFTGTAEKLLGGAGTLQEPRFALQQILLEISNSLSETELKQMKFLVKPKLNAFRLAKIREGFELFEELDASGVSSCTYLRELLKGIQRFDLLEKLDVSLFTSAESADGAFCMEQGPEQEPRSHPPTRQRMLDRITQSSSSPQGDHNLDLLPDDTMMEKPSLLSSGDNLLQVQSSYEEGLTTAEGDLVTETRETDKLENQPRLQLYHPTHMEPRDGVDSLRQHNNRKPDSKRKRTFLSAKNDDDVVRLITTAAERDSQEQIERLQRELHECEVENQILQAELKTTSFPVDQHVSSENIFQLSREHAVGMASHVEKDLHDAAGSLPGARSHSPTGQKLLNRITESSVLPPIDHNPGLLPPRHDGGFDETSDGIHTHDNGRVSGINEAGPVPNMSCRNSVNSGSDTIVLANNPNGEDSSVHRRYPDSSKSVSFSNESSSTTASSSELSVSSLAEATKVESTSSSCAAHSVCDGSSRVTLCQLTAVKSRDTCSISPTSGEEETLENTLSNECGSGSIDTREDYASKNEEIGKVSESSGDISEGPGNPHHLKAKSAASVAKDDVDCGPLRSPDRPGAEARSQRMQGLKRDVLPNGDISEEQNVSGAFSGAGESTTVDQLVSDASTQSKLWTRLGARPRDRPPMKMPPQTSLIDLVPQGVAEPMASGLTNAFLARHSQDQNLHLSLCQGSAVKLLSDETYYMDLTKHSSEPNKTMLHFGDCQVVPRPDVDNRWKFPPPLPGGEYDSYNAVGGYAYNTQLNVAQFNGHVGPLSSYVTGGTNNFSSSNAFNSSNYNSFKSNLALAAREPDLTLHRQRDSELNTSVPGNQRLHSGMTGSHIANVSLMGAAGLQLTPPVHALQRYSGPSDNALTVASEREQTQPAWKANSKLTSIGNMARVDVGSSGLPAPLIATRSNGADNRHVLEAGSSTTSQLGTGGSDLLNTSGDRVVAGASRDVDSTHTETALLSAESRGSRLVVSANGDSNLEPRGAEASLVPVNTGGSMLNRDFGTDSVESTDNSLLALEQRVEEACALVERVLREREEREQFGREIERKEREIRERRARKKKEREAREQEEASRWPQQQEAITGRSQWLCEHYQRHCRVRFPCCSHFYSCHRCHNNSKACDNEEAKASHATHLKCSFCQHEQEIGEDSGKCRSCGAQMSAYFCSICKHFTSVDKNPYHCEKCGICRIHKDKSFHCDVCNVCLDKRLEGKHKCRPDSGHDECCICLEDAFSGCQILPCSHKVHRECAIAMIQNGIRTCPVCRHPLYDQASE